MSDGARAGSTPATYRTYRCKQGHASRVSDGSRDYFSFGNGDGETHQLGLMCPVCLVAFVREHFGMEEVEP